jgi:multicomponent Na+:H+ antiporter subunit D
MAEAALAIALPLAAAMLALPLGRRAPWLMAVVGPASLWLAWGTARSVPTIHPLGGWEPPLGILLRVDGLAAAFVALAAIVAGAAGLYAIRYLGEGEKESRRRFAFWPLFFALWAAVNAVFLSRDLFNLYVALELVTLAAVGMVALDGRIATLAAAMRYLLFALFGSIAFLIGTALLYGAYGTLDMRLLGEAVEPGPAAWVAAALITAGLLAKTALFPFHAWLPPAHSGAPAPASALLSALVVKASFYILFRLWFDALPRLGTTELVNLFGLLGTTAVLYGAAMAIRQTRLKLVVAYSTVAQLGYLFLVFPLVGGVGEAQPWAAGAWSGAVFHGLSHGLAKAAMFLAAGTMMLSAGDDRIANMAGIGKSVPVASFAFALAAVSLMGLPPSGGFLAKYLMLTASFAGGQWWWGLVLVAGGLMTAIYLFRPLNQLMRARDAGAPPLARVHWSLETVPLVLALAAILLGLTSIEPYRLIQSGSPVAAEMGLP